MVSKTALDIAAAIGAPVQNLTGNGDWSPPYHPQLVVGELYYSDGTGCICYRITDKSTGEIMSAIPSEQAKAGDDGGMADIYAKLLDIGITVQQQIIPAIAEAVPDLQVRDDLVALQIGGRNMVADLVAGKLENLRDAPVLPEVSVDADWQISLDVSKMREQDQTAAADSIEAVKAAPDMAGKISQASMKLKG